MDITLSKNKQPELMFAFDYDELNEEPKPMLIPDAADLGESALTSLNSEEQMLLEDCENAIEDSMGAFYEIGHRLRIIKVKKLYRASHRSFTEYCSEQWGFGIHYANRLMKGSEVVDNLKTVPIGTVSLPGSEAACRPLTDLETSKQIQVGRIVKESVGDREPTAIDFEKAKKQVVESGKNHKEPPIESSAKPSYRKQAQHRSRYTISPPSRPTKDSR